MRGTDIAWHPGGEGNWPFWVGCTVCSQDCRLRPGLCPSTAEACSTTEDGAEPLLCPSGYECHILQPGDAAQGIPNHGRCVKQRRQAGERYWFKLPWTDPNPTAREHLVTPSLAQSPQVPLPVSLCPAPTYNSSSLCVCYLCGLGVNFFISLSLRFFPCKMGTTSRCHRIG